MDEIAPEEELILFKVNDTLAYVMNKGGDQFSYYDLIKGKERVDYFDGVEIYKDDSLGYFIRNLKKDKHDDPEVMIDEDLVRLKIRIRDTIRRDLPQCLRPPKLTRKDFEKLEKLKRKFYNSKSRKEMRENGTRLSEFCSRKMVWGW